MLNTTIMCTFLLLLAIKTIYIYLYLTRKSSLIQIAYSVCICMISWTQLHLLHSPTNVVQFFFSIQLHNILISVKLDKNNAHSNL